MTVHEKRKVNADQSNPAAAHHTITTVGRPDNTRVSALVRSRSTQFMVSPNRWPQRRSPETSLHLCHFRGDMFAMARLQVQLRKISLLQKTQHSSFYRGNVGSVIPRGQGSVSSTVSLQVHCVSIFFKITHELGSRQTIFPVEFFSVKISFFVREFGPN